MRNFKIATVLGIPIKINITLVIFLPLLAWLIGSDVQMALWSDLISTISPMEVDAADLKPNSLLLGAVAAGSLFLGVTIHELGHSWVAQRYGITISSITLWIFGGMAHMEDLPEEWQKEFWIAIAGPITSVALGVIGFVLLQVTPSSPEVVFALGYFAIMNIALAIFNMLPAFPMDGGRILRALLSRSRSYADATRIAANVGKFFAVLMAVLGILNFSPILVLIAMFIYVAASSESKITVIREMLEGVKIGDIMSREILSVEASTSVQDLVNGMLAERRREYLVTDQGEVVGFVTLDDVRTVREDERHTTQVSEIMEKEMAVVSPYDDAFEALRAFGRGNETVVVEDSGEIVGTVSQNDIVEALQIIQGVGPMQPGKPISDYAYP